MCNCIKNIEEKTIDWLRENEKGDISVGKLMHTQFPLIKRHRSLTIQDRVTYSDFQYKHAPIKKDGSFGKSITRTATIAHSFCPFCGEKYPES